MRFLLAALLAALATAAPVHGQAAAATGATAHAAAKDELASLRKDEQRRSLRHHWMNLARKFDRLAKDPALKCDALFNGGGLYAELSQYSKLAEDRDAARSRFVEVATRCPGSSLADDALFAAAQVLKRTDPPAARGELEQQLRRFPKGDMAAKAREALAALPQPQKRAMAAVAAKAVVAAKPARSAAAKVARPAAAPAEAKEPKSAQAAAPAETTEPKSAQAAAPAEAKEPKSARAAAPAEATEPKAAKPAAPAAAVASDEAALEAADRALVQASQTADRVLAALSGGDEHRPSEVAYAQDLARAEAELDRSQLKKLAKLGSGELSLSMVAGLKVRRVVIDAGHGGHDVGAVGPSGIKEAEVTLQIARRLKEKLESQGLEVILTRDRETFVALEDRTRLANEQRADLFISIHCNAAPQRKTRGIETYTLNLNSDRYALKLAARENAGSSRSVGDLHLILADLATKANTDDSVRLADHVQRELVGNLRRGYGSSVRDLGTKEALFFVLMGAKMPAILVEASFLSNPEEEKRLASSAYQDEVARSIAEGVRGFIGAREAIAQGPGAVF